MTDRDFELTDFVSSRQNPRKPTLRNVLEYHFDDIEPVEHDLTDNHAVKLDEDLYLWEKKEDLPDELPKANYVVIDALYFCTTAIEILSAGASKLWVHETHDQVEERGLEDPDIRIGGERGEGYHPREEYDFFNSPSFIQELDLEGREVMMTSDNGAVAALKVKRAQPEANVYLGSTTNPLAVARKLRDSYQPLHIVCSGLKGDTAAEDHIAAFLICKHLSGRMKPEEIEKVEKIIREMNDFYYDNSPEIRQKDIEEYVSDVNSQDIVPLMVQEADGYSFVVSD